MSEEYWKPCPVCGSENIHAETVVHPNDDGSGYVTWAVSCRECDCIGPSPGNLKQAVYEWNNMPRKAKAIASQVPDEEFLSPT